MAIRADMIRPRQLTPAQSGSMPIFQLVPEGNHLVKTAEPYSVIGQVNGVMPAVRARPIEQLPSISQNPQPALVLVEKSQPAQTDLGSHDRNLERSMLDSLIDLSKAKDKKSDKWISGKIRTLRHEGKPHKQSIAIAFNMAGRSRKQIKKSLFVTI